AGGPRSRRDRDHPGTGQQCGLGAIRSGAPRDVGQAFQRNPRPPLQPASTRTPQRIARALEFHTTLTSRRTTVTTLAQQNIASPTDKVIYTAKTHTTGGRENGAARSSDGQLEIRISPPGSQRPGTNPEQLFAAGWSACFEGALGVVAQRKKIKLPADL